MALFDIIIGISALNLLLFVVVNVVSKAKQILFLLFKCFHTRNINVLLKAYKTYTYVSPILDYWSVVWLPYTEVLIDNVESVQKYFVRKLFGVCCLTH